MGSCYQMKYAAVALIMVLCTLSVWSVSNAEISPVDLRCCGILVRKKSSGWLFDFRVSNAPIKLDWSKLRGNPWDFGKRDFLQQDSSLHVPTMKAYIPSSLVWKQNPRFLRSILAENTVKIMKPVPPYDIRLGIKHVELSLCVPRGEHILNVGGLEKFPRAKVDFFYQNKLQLRFRSGGDELVVPFLRPIERRFYSHETVGADHFNSDLIGTLEGSDQHPLQTGEISERQMAPSRHRDKGFMARFRRTLNHGTRDGTLGEIINDRTETTHL